MPQSPCFGLSAAQTCQRCFAGQKQLWHQATNTPTKAPVFLLLIFLLALIKRTTSGIPANMVWMGGLEFLRWCPIYPLQEPEVQTPIQPPNCRCSLKIGPAETRRSRFSFRPAAALEGPAPSASFAGCTWAFASPEKAIPRGAATRHPARPHPQTDCLVDKVWDMRRSCPWEGGKWS